MARGAPDDQERAGDVPGVVSCRPWTRERSARGRAAMQDARSARRALVELGGESFLRRATRKVAGRSFSRGRVGPRLTGSLAGTGACSRGRVGRQREAPVLLSDAEHATLDRVRDLVHWVTTAQDLRTRGREC